MFLVSVSVAVGLGQASLIFQVAGEWRVRCSSIAVGFKQMPIDLVHFIDTKHDAGIFKMKKLQKG